MLAIEDLSLDGKTVFLRVDMNTPCESSTRKLILFHYGLIAKLFSKAPKKLEYDIGIDNDRMIDEATLMADHANDFELGNERILDVGTVAFL
jgi:hypothetical protein